MFPSRIYYDDIIMAKHTKIDTETQYDAVQTKLTHSWTLFPAVKPLRHEQHNVSQEDIMISVPVPGKSCLGLGHCIIMFQSHLLLQ